jgi:hypothetical protein
MCRAGRFVANSVAMGAFALLLAGRSGGATVTAGTLRAWDQAVHQAKVELALQTSNPDGFLSIDRQPERFEKAQRGGILSIYSPHGGGLAVPSGLIHHWIGTVFIPNVRLLDAVTVLQDYDSYAEIYQPGVIDSKLLSRTGGEFKYRLKFVQKGFGVKAGLLGEFRSTYFRLNRSTGYSVTEATDLIELQDAGGPAEQRLPLSAARGYVERVFTIVRYRESQGGVYLEVDTLTLSRGVPVSIRWLIAPLIQRFSRQTMADTLERVRDKVGTTRAVESASTLRHGNNASGR